MTVSTDVSSFEYDTDGVTTSFPAPFYFLTKSDLYVTLYDPATETSTDLVLGSAYDVTGAGDPAGGAVITSTVYPTGLKLRGERLVDVTQETAYQRNDPFPERAHERALDKLTMIAQQFENWLGTLPGALGRVLHLPVEYPRRSSLLPAVSVRARKALIFDDDGNVAVGTDDYEDQAANAAASAAAAAQSATAADEARDEAVRIATEFGDLDSAVDRAETAADSAEEDADRAEAAANAASAAGRTYTSVAEGLAHTSNGDFFTVAPSAYGGLYDLYLNNAGVAQYFGTYPSLEAIELVLTLLQESVGGPAYVFRDEAGFHLGHITPTETDLPGIAARDDVDAPPTFQHSDASGYGLVSSDDDQVRIGSLSTRHVRTNDGFALTDGENFPAATADEKGIKIGAMEVRQSVTGDDIKISDTEGFPAMQATSDQLNLGALSVKYSESESARMTDDAGFGGFEATPNQVNIGPAGLRYSAQEIPSIVDETGFAGAFPAFVDENREGLADHMDAILNEMRDYNVVLVGDSKLWGQRLPENSPVEPSSHTLATPRDNLASPSWANLFRLRLGQSFMGASATDVPTQDQPGSGYWTKEFKVDVCTNTRFIVVDANGSEAPRMVAVDEAAAFGHTLTIPPGQSAEFFAHCAGFSVAYVATPDSESAEFTVESNGVEYARQNFYAPSVAYGQETNVVVPFAARTVRIVNRSRVSLSLEFIRRTKMIRVANQGISGTNSREWLPFGDLLPAAARPTDTHSFIALGTNDRRRPNPSVFQDNLTVILRWLRGAHGLSTALIADSAARETSDWPNDDYVIGMQDIRRAVYAVGAAEKADVIDFYDITRQTMLDGTDLWADGLHEHAIGHKLKFTRLWSNLMSQRELINVY